MEELNLDNTRNIETERTASVKQAVVSRFPRLITANLDTEFQKAITQKTDPDAINKNLSNNALGVRKAGMVRSAQAFSVDRVFQAPHNPFRNRYAVETPTNYVENIQRYRYYFKYEPLVGTAIELHSEFPLSTFEMKHEDPTLQEEFNDIAENLNLFEFLLDMALEYWICGSAFPFGIFDNPKQPQEWKAFILLNPLFVDVSSVPITDGRPNEIIKLKIDNIVRKVVSNGPNDKSTGDLYRRIPQDVIEATKGDGYLVLNSQQVSHFKRKGNYFSARGESLLSRIIHLLNYRDKLRDSSYATADRHACPREVWKVGETDSPATAEELASFSNMLSASYNDPNTAIVWHHALSCDVIGTGDKFAPIRQELDGIEEEILVGLMLNKGFLDSAYGAYANMSVALDVLISRYIIFRQRMERWIKDCVWAPICRIHNIYRPTPAELSHRIRIKNVEKTPWTPKVIWSKYELRDSTQKVNLLLQLREKLKIGNKAGFPRDLIYQYINENPKSIRKMVEKEAKDDAVSASAVSLAGAPPPVGGLAGGLPSLNIDTSKLGGEIGGGEAVGAPPPAAPGGAGAIPESELPEFTAGGGGGEAAGRPGMPPESAKIENEKSPTS